MKELRPIDKRQIHSPTFEALGAEVLFYMSHWTLMAEIRVAGVTSAMKLDHDPKVGMPMILGRIRSMMERKSPGKYDAIIKRLKKERRDARMDNQATGGLQDTVGPGGVGNPGSEAPTAEG